MQHYYGTDADSPGIYIQTDADRLISAQGDRDVDDDYLRDLNYALIQ